MRTGEQRSFNFRELAKEEWDLYWPKINFSSLYQSWEYGEAKKAKAIGFLGALFVKISVDNFYGANTY